MSFFDEADEPRRPRPRRSPRTGGGRPPIDHQTLLVRRLVAAGGVIVVVILLVLLVKGCVDSRRAAALKRYNNDVHSIMEESRSVSKQLFDALSGAGGQQGQQIQETVNQLGSDAKEDLARAQRLDAPGEMSEAQRDLVLVLSLRRDAVQTISDLIQKAVGKSAAASTAVNEIAGQMRAFDASDVVYSQRVAPLVLRALKDDGINASYDGSAGERVAPESAFLPSMSWINPAFVGGALGASAGGGASGTPTPGLHGHALDSVAVGSTTLDPAGSNRISANPPPTFTVTFTNGGEHDEINVPVTVTITGVGAPIAARAIVPSTTAGQQMTTNVQLAKAPPTSGPVTIKVSIGKVPGEKTLDNNSQTYSALFD